MALLSRLLRPIKRQAATDTYAIHFPIHIHGVTLFPKARYLDDCWRGMIDIVSGSGLITVHWCVGGHPAEAIALAFVRLEMRSLVRSLREAPAPLR